jgi:tetratricopeptide (TPR) repeat protein
LRRLIGEPAPGTRRAAGDGRDRAADQKAASALIGAVTGGHAGLRDHLRSLTAVLEGRDAAAAGAVVERIMPLIPSEPPWVKHTFAATLLWHWHRLELPPRPLIAALRRDRRSIEWQRETQRLLALMFERAGAWDEALLAWDGYLAAATRAGTLPSTGRVPARILLHMAELFPTDSEEVLDVLGVDSEEEIEQLVRDGELPECFARGRLLTRAIAADPEPRVFRALVAHWEARDRAQAEAHAEAWRRAHPEDLEPLLHLVRAAEARGAHRRAIEMLGRAEAIDPMHPELRQSRLRLLLTSAEGRIREGRNAQALADLDELDKAVVATSGETWVYLGALRWLATRRAGDGPGAERLLEELASRLVNRTMLGLIVSSVAESFGLEPPETLDAASPAESAQALARAGDLFRALGRPLAVPAGLLARVERGLGEASPADLHSLCGAGLHIGRPALTYAAAGEGLTGDGPLLHRFLLARGRALALAGARRDRDRAVACFRAARELAGRSRDLDAAREASSALGALGPGVLAASSSPLGDLDGADRPTSREIAAILATERARREPPAFKALTEGRKRRRGARRAQRDLFDDLLPFMERGH